jgi:hypothetical protein
MSRLAFVLAAGCALALTPHVLRAQAVPFDGPRGAVEVGAVHERFHREMEPSAYSDTRWNITSILVTYRVAEWFGVGMQGGISTFNDEDFAGSEFTRYSVGAIGSVRALRRGAWDVGANARFLDTFDQDSSPTLLHKRVRSVSASVDVAYRFVVAGQSGTVWAGPLFVDDLVQTFAWDAVEAVETTSGGALGAALGGRVVVRVIALFAYVNYVDDFQGGVGISLYAKDGGY